MLHWYMKSDCLAPIYTINNDVKERSTQLVLKLWAQLTIDTWWVSQDKRIFSNMNSYLFH